MEKVLNKTENRKSSCCNELDMFQIEQFYLKNMTDDLKIGLEYERLSVDKRSLKSASYEKIKKIIENFSSILKWELIYDDNTIIGAKDNCGTSISLEPGCQFELSLAPEKDICKIAMKASEIIDLLDKIADAYDVLFLGYGITPKSSVDEINILNKRRYKIMNNYLPYCSKGEFCPKMMRQTAGIQINVDYKNNEDAYNKLKLFNLILPFISGLYSNSPIENDTISEYKSIRNRVWQYTGENRCNLFYKNIFNKRFFKNKNIFKNYINEILDVPMVFITRDDKYIPIDGKINFKEFLRYGFNGYSAEYEDYINHQSLCFPDVRLKNYIEIRNHDSNSIEYALALCAFYKGICLSDIKTILNELDFLNFKDIDKYYELSSKFGLDFKIKNKTGWQIASLIFQHSSNNLDTKERSYLEPILNLIKQEKTPADIIIDSGIENAQDLVDFI